MGPDLKEIHLLGETKHKGGSHEVPQKMLGHPLLGEPWASPEEWQPSSKAFRSGTHNSTVLQEKFQHSPKAIWQMTSFANPGEAKSPAGQGGTFQHRDPEL